MNVADVVYLLALAVGGLVVASFVNAAIVRWIGWRVVLPQLLGSIPPASSLRRTPARCRECGAPLSWWSDRAISWVTTLGRCRGPGRHRIDVQHLVVELLVAGLWVGLGVEWGRSSIVAPQLVLVTGLVAMATVDLLVMRIPNRFVYATHAVLIPVIVVVSVQKGIPEAVSGAIVGAILYFGFLLVFHLVSPRRMGFGDVRLAGVMGLVLGWLGWRSDLWITRPLVWVIWGALIGSLLGTLAGVGSLIVRRRNRPFPFGPALATGCILVLFLGDNLVGR